MLDNNGTLTAIFRNLHRARRAAERGAEQIKGAAPNLATEPRIAESYNLAGMIYLYLAEAYCSGVPISDADPISGELVFGPSLSTAQLLARRPSSSRTRPRSTRSTRRRPTSPRS